MSTLLKQVAQPQSKSSKAHPSEWDDCPYCSSIKKRDAKRCKRCTGKVKISMSRQPVPQPDNPCIRYIPLTEGRVAIVDTENFDRVNQLNWHALKIKGKYYAYCSGLRDADGRQIRTGMHTFILNTKRGQWIDHLNGDGLCNLESNLRPCTPSQNQHNRQKAKNNTTGYTGISRTESGRWSAGVVSKRKYHHAGTFDTKEEAAQARDALAKLVHGDFAHLNFPHPEPS